MLKFEDHDAPLHYKIVGNGARSLLFLHGFLEDHSMWNTVYPELVNRGFQCILVDLPCHGMSRYNGEICTMQHIALVLNRFLDAQQIEHVWVIGHSMGGYAGLELLRLKPALKLVLLHSHFWEDGPGKKTDRNRVIEIVKKNKNLFLSEAIPALFAPQNRQRCAADIRTLVEKAAKIPAGEIAAITAGMRDRNALHDIAGTGRVSCIQGTEDPVVLRSKLESECEKLPNKPTIAWIENCAHMSIWEQPAALINCLEITLIE